MVTIVMRDALRAQVERASQGRQTVLYTAKGQPSYMNVVPLVTLAALGLAGAEGPHPAFIVGGRERGEFFYGSYGGVIRAGELVSLPGVAPGAWMDFAGASDAAGLRIGLAPEHQRGARRADAVVPAAWSCGAGQHRQRPLHPRARGARPASTAATREAGRSGHADRQRSGALAARPHGPWHRGPVRQPLGMAGRAAAGGRGNPDHSRQRRRAGRPVLGIRRLAGVEAVGWRAGGAGASGQREVRCVPGVQGRECRRADAAQPDPASQRAGGRQRQSSRLDGCAVRPD